MRFRRGHWTSRDWQIASQTSRLEELSGLVLILGGQTGSEDRLALIRITLRSYRLACLQHKFPWALHALVHPQPDTSPDTLDFSSSPPQPP